MTEPQTIDKDLLRECKVVCHHYQYWWTYKNSRIPPSFRLKQDNCIEKCIDIKTKWEQNKKPSI